MHRSLAALALSLPLVLVSSVAAAQTIVVIEAPPPPPVIVVIEPPPPPEIVIVQAPPPAEVVVVEPPAPPPTVSTYSSPPPAPRFVIDLLGNLALGVGYPTPAFGGEARLGLSFDQGGVIGALALGYRGEVWEGGSEMHLGIEIERDFSPADPLASFLLVGQVGTAFSLGDRADLFDAGIRLSGELGIGGRFSLGGDVTLLLDMRALLRFRPDDPRGPRSSDVDAGMLFNVGIRLPL